MKVIHLYILFIILAVTTCRENLIETDDEIDTTGIIYVASQPSGAAIYWNNWNMLKSTPDSLKNVYPGIHYIALRRAGFRDTTVTVYMQSHNRSQLNIELIPE